MEFILIYENLLFYYFLFQYTSVSWRSFHIVRPTSFMFTAAGYFVYEYCISYVTCISMDYSVYSHISHVE